jgi:hypothetical protein
MVEMSILSGTTTSRLARPVTGAMELLHDRRVKLPIILKPEDDANRSVV